MSRFYGLSILTASAVVVFGIPASIFFNNRHLVSKCNNAVGNEPCIRIIDRHPDLIEQLNPAGKATVNLVVSQREALAKAEAEEALIRGENLKPGYLRTVTNGELQEEQRFTYIIETMWEHFIHSQRLTVVTNGQQQHYFLEPGGEGHYIKFGKDVPGQRRHDEWIRLNWERFNSDHIKITDTKGNVVYLTGTYDRVNIAEFNAEQQSKRLRHEQKQRQEAEAEERRRNAELGRDIINGLGGPLLQGIFSN